MSITFVLIQGQTLHLQGATPEQMEQVRQMFQQGRGSFEFTVDGRTFVVNGSNVLYVEVVPG